MSYPTQLPEPALLTVSQLTLELKELVESGFPLVWVQGEISNCTKAGSGHIYLTLKDDRSQLRAVIWRGVASRLKFDIRDGMDVVAAGAVEVYAARGTYQLVVEQLIPKGIGPLELAFRQLQERLAAEGLFDPERKRPLPRFPRRIAIITSPASAAIRDMLQVITRRWNGSNIVILPVAVQGDGAAEQIAAALRYVHRIPDVDVVITGRGGGSLEDLWAFNEEIVARAIFDCPIPVISAVGHEVDVSIADFVADRRALTPSEAGELVVPERSEIMASLNRQHMQLVAALRDRAAQSRFQLDAIASRPVLSRPLNRLHDMSLRLDELAHRLERSAAQQFDAAAARLARVATALDALSPLKVLSRGYSITHSADDDAVVKSTEQLAIGDRLRTRLHSGEAISRVEAIRPNGGRPGRDSS